ncbi:MAG: Flp pilus assembly complex ATPase component TadA [Deltaproteobacteria bacterium]|nr:Flp pilus assembly complex ATPase component TadA [Deltaproteobacteria bacterium]
MFTVTVTEKCGKIQILEFEKNELTVGRTQLNDIVLPKGNISKQHARIICKNGSFIVIDSKSTNGTFINGNRISEPYDLKNSDKIDIGDFTISIKKKRKKKLGPNDPTGPHEIPKPPEENKHQEPESSNEPAEGEAYNDDWSQADDDAVNALEESSGILSSDEILEVSGQEDIVEPEKNDTDHLVDQAVAPTEARDILGVSLLNQWLHDDTISAITANGPYSIQIDRSGQIEHSEQLFADVNDMTEAIRQVANINTGSNEQNSPIIDTRFEDGTYFNAILTPWAVDGPSLIIRKQSQEPLQVDELVAHETLTAAMSIFLENCVLARKNIIVTGCYDSGKTTTLNVLANFIPVEQRVVTIENVCELRLELDDVVRLQANPQDANGTKQSVSLYNLVHTAMGFRTERLILGDCQGDEALAWLHALSNGFDGSLLAIQAHNTASALLRLETLALAAYDNAAIKQTLRELIANNVDIIVHQRRFADGVRRVAAIAEVVGVEGDFVATRNLFIFDHKGLDSQGKILGRFRPTGIVPSFYDSLQEFGITADASIFQL